MPVVNSVRAITQARPLAAINKIQPIPVRGLLIVGPLLARMILRPVGAAPVPLPKIRVGCKQNRKIRNDLIGEIAAEKREALGPCALNLLQRETWARAKARYRATVSLRRVAPVDTLSD